MLRILSIILWPFAFKHTSSVWQTVKPRPARFALLEAGLEHKVVRVSLPWSVTVHLQALSAWGRNDNYMFYSGPTHLNYP